MPEPVSVIITCYNLQPYVAEAVRSVQEQEYDGEVQIIVVDDNSTDGSQEILESIDGIELVLRPQNGGVMRAMISGLRAVRHDMIFFLDGDDLWHREKLARCMEGVTAQTKFCTHDLWYMDCAGRELSRPSRVSEVLGRAEHVAHGLLIEKCLLEHGDYVWLGSAFGVSRSRGAISAFIAFCEQRDYLDLCYQDWPLAAWIALQPGGEFVFSNSKLFGYRLHAENYSGASQTLEKLRRNLTKSLGTMQLIEEIAIAKNASAETLRHYRKVRLRYELMFSLTSANRKQIVIRLIRSFPQLRADLASLKIVLRAGLALIFGPERAHAVIETLKS